MYHSWVCFQLHLLLRLGYPPVRFLRFIHYHRGWKPVRHWWVYLWFWPSSCLRLLRRANCNPPVRSSRRTCKADYTWSYQFFLWLSHNMCTGQESIFRFFHPLLDLLLLFDQFFQLNDFKCTSRLSVLFPLSLRIGSYIIIQILYLIMNALRRLLPTIIRRMK